MEGCVRWDDVTCSSGTVSILGWANELSLLSLLELADTLVPATDDLANADLELERDATGYGTIEDAAIRELASVMNLDNCTFGDDLADTVV